MMLINKYLKCYVGLKPIIITISSRLPILYELEKKSNY